MQNGNAQKVSISKRALAFLLGAVLAATMLPANTMSVFADTSTVQKLNITGYDKDIYYVVTDDIDQSAGERDHAHATVPGTGGSQDFVNIAGTNVNYYIAGVTSTVGGTLASQTFYGSSKMTWLEYWLNEGLTASTLTDTDGEDLDPDSEAGGHVSTSGKGYYDLGGFDAVARPTIEYGINHFSYQYIQTFHGIDEASDDVLENDSVFARRKASIGYDGVASPPATGDALVTDGKIGQVSSWTPAATYVAGQSKGDYTSTNATGTWAMENYDVEGFQRIPVKVNAELYIENSILNAAEKGDKVSAVFENFTLNGTDGAGNIVTAATGGMKELKANGQYGKQTAGVNGKLAASAENSPELKANGYGMDLNYSWGDYADAYIYLGKIDSTETKADLTQVEYEDYCAKFLSAKYEFYGDNAAGTGTPKATYGTVAGADQWYAPYKKARIELGFNFDSLRLGGTGKNTTADGILNKGGAVGKTGWYKVTLYAAGYNDISTMVYIPKQASKPTVSLTTDNKRLYLTDIDPTLKPALTAGTANVVLQSVVTEGRTTTTDTIKDFSSVKIDANDCYDISDITLDADTNYRLSIAPDGFAPLTTDTYTLDTIVRKDPSKPATSDPEATLASLTLNVNKATIYTKGIKTVALKATVIGDSKTIAWNSSNNKIATVSANGVVTAKKVGKVTITAIANGKSATASITVKAPTLKLKKASATIKKGKKVTIKPTATPVAKIAYKTSNKKVATVTSKGVVKGIKKGTAKITVSANGVKSTFTVKVK